ncbi:MULTISPECIES: biotin carboxylase N-terminal domain-containing protein [Rhodomicrobium]|uniref:ATP-binding protein n=1 Tax=Rhodomicrobium TaxID=1068 RepID=UPI000B4B2FE2|nr:MULTISPECIES: biotin carboxylase N-terminal domain-containing protein [Rhodomicrobium]
MFKSVLIANRGEIALRVIRTAKRLGMRAVAVHSAADRTALHVKAADESIEIGPAPSADSYLRQDRVVAAALTAGAECVHPGSGFLAENAEFAEACARAGLVFVGPSPEAIRIMGQKDEAKRLAAKLGIPTVPGYSGEAQDDATFAREAAQIGYPVVLKAIAGGGGKGLKPVFAAGDLSEAAASARREAQAAFGDSRLMIEKLIEPARHIEVQVFGDSHGHAVHLFERECTLQRRSQKVIEEAPAINMPAGLRARMTEAALSAARAVNYLGAGTVEFLVPGGPMTDETPFYFMEMNTRLQIEHPVTELITGLDLVEWQFLVAAGKPLPLAQKAIKAKGAAVEARLYAEDPATGFLPSPGRIWLARFPEGDGVRIDSGVETGSEVPPYYDAMIAKIIGFGTERGAAYDRLLGALEATVLAGPQTNLAFLHGLAARAKSGGERLSTRYIEGHLAELTAAEDDAAAVRLGALALIKARQCEATALRRAISDEPHSPWDINDSFDLTTLRKLTYDVEANGAHHSVAIDWTPTGPRLVDGSPTDTAETIPTDDGIIVWRAMRPTRVRFAPRQKADAADASGGGLLRAPMPGRLAKMFVGEGDRVARGDRMAVVEAMKMEHILHAPADGIVKSLTHREGDQVDLGAVIAELEMEGAHASD